MSQKYCKKLKAMVVTWKDGSHEWRTMLDCRDLVEHQILWQPKRGSTLFWFDNWIGLGLLYFVTPSDFYCDETVHNISDVVQDGAWDEDRLREILPKNLAIHILENVNPLILHDDLDIPYWILETRGDFSVKSARNYLRSRRDSNIPYRNM